MIKKFICDLKKFRLKNHLTKKIKQILSKILLYK